MWNSKIVMGVEKPSEEPKDIDAMRRAITDAARDSGIVNRCLMSAEFQGLSGEDKYAMLAYYALRSLEDIYRQHMQLVMCTPRTVTFELDDSVKAALSASGEQ